MPIEPTEAELLALDNEIYNLLASAPGVDVPPIPNAAQLLAPAADGTDAISAAFNEYFQFHSADDPPHSAGRLPPEKIKRLIDCARSFPPPWSGCVSLGGVRGRMRPPPRLESSPSIRSLFVGDVAWLYFMERMGTFQILGVLLDDWATRGRLVLRNHDFAAYVLELMTRDMKTGISTTVRDRASTDMRVLGWTTDAARKLGIQANVNTAFNSLFQKLVSTGLEYFRDRRLAQAIQRTDAGGPSLATETAIRDTITLLHRALDPFDYGRNYVITLQGIVWAIATLAIVRDLRTSLGIPESYTEPDQFLPAAYDILVLGKPATLQETNRFQLHFQCARYSRDILLHVNAEIGGRPYILEGNDQRLATWLHLAERHFEGYRTAYRTLTGIDLGTTSASVDQAA
ncbi:MAG TPA: hypothetical protein VM925_13765 [Labilithrix sp.]|nr:hypothetical protein [Labilithrix sp.]